MFILYVIAFIVLFIAGFLAAAVIGVPIFAIWLFFAASPKKGAARTARAKALREAEALARQRAERPHEYTTIDYERLC